MGRFVRGMLLGLLMVFAAGVWPAAAQVDSANTKVTAPAAGAALKGFYDSDGTPKAFSYTLSGKAASNCSNGFKEIKFSVTNAQGYSKTFTPISTSNGSSWAGNAPAVWNTQDLNNGVYSVRLTVTDNSCLLHGSSTYPTKNDVKLANAPVAPEWSGAPAAAGDGSAVVSLTWKKNPEADVINYQITRNGPDGSVTAIAPASVCGTSTCQAQDRSFPGDYSGTYAYQIVTYRSAPAGTGEACSPGSSADCVKSNGSDIKSVTLTKPTPSPSPTDSPTGGSPTPKPGGGSGSGSGGGSSSSSNTSRPTRVLSFGGGGSSYNDFYTGTYNEQLPYAPKTLVIGNGKTTTPSDSRNEAAALSEDPPNYRTIMLPVAGGLLAFLSAAHVRRLLIHF